MRRRTETVERLTPREWEVLALVREGLTNEQIASRIGISRDGVKYHVSEILGKLGVEDRIEAARWYDRETRQRAGVWGFLGGLFRLREGAKPSMQAPAFAVIVVAALAFVALLAGVLVMQSRGGGEPEALPEDRRTGDLQLDELLTSLLSDDEATVRGTATAGAAARQRDDATEPETIYELDAWAGLLTAASGREIYAVKVGHPQSAPERDFEVYLRVVTPGGEVEGWRVAVNDYRVVDIYIGEDELAFVAQSVGYQFEEFVVLPPEEDRPQPPPSHDLTARTGDPEIDAALEALAAHDAAGLLAQMAYERTPCGPDALPFCDSQPAGTLVDAVGVTDCNRQPRQEGREFIERRLTAIAGQAAGIVGVARLPEGYVPGGDALIIVLGEETPYVWEMNGLVMASGRIVGLVSRCSPREDLLYPPSGFVVLPPAGDLEGLDAARRSGNDVIDAFLDALAAGDIDGMQSLTRFEQIECVTEQLGIGAPPLCLDGESAGTVVEALPLAQCEGHYSRSEEFPETLARLAEGEWSLYAVLDLGSPDPGQYGFGPGAYEVVLYDGARDEFARSIALAFDDAGLTLIWYGCGPRHPSEMFWTGRAPDWVLAPP